MTSTTPYNATASRVFALAALTAAAPLALAQDLIAASAPESGQTVLRIINLNDGSHMPYMTLPIPSDMSYLRTLSPLPGNRLIACYYAGTASVTPRIIKIDPLTGETSEVILGAPLTSRYIEAFEWSPRHNAIIVSHANLGNFGTSSIALVDENGTVLANAASSPTQADLDHVACSETEDYFIDLNRATSNRVVRLATPFPTPTFTNFASPPNMAEFHDITIEPGTGRLLFANGPGTSIIHLNGNTYTTAATLQGGLSVRAISFATVPPRIQTQPAHTITCPGGTLTLSIVATGGSPTYRWQRLVADDWADLADGPTATGSTLSGTGSHTLTINTFAFEDDGSYRCLITDAAAPDGILSEHALARACLANYNCDGEVDILDFLDFMDDFGSCDGQSAPCGNSANADITGDTIVDIVDLLDFLDAFGRGC
ncbi:MAG: immunoglobulin domain-containing protein [Phycisphaeraceae bacterium]|nr:immunoglobulin domain-containing protein [Phycisphaeraceae bacterium]